jgi:hypothetical protein
MPDTLMATYTVTSLYVVLLLFGAAMAAHCIRKRHQNPRGLPYPPGPPGACAPSAVYSCTNIPVIQGDLS